MKYTRCFVTLLVLQVIGASQNMWVETSQADFCDGVYERNIYASHRDGGTLEFAPRFDLNNDGYIDLFTADVSGPDVKIYWGSAGGFGPSRSFPTTGADNCDAADIDRDGYPDFVISHRNAHKISIYWGSAAGPSPSNVSDINTITTAHQGVFLADFNRDGYLDLATGHQFASGNSAILWGSVSGYSSANRTDLPVDWSVHNIEVADFDRDGWLDVLFTNYLHLNNLIYWGSSSGFSPSNQTALENPYGSHGTSVADLNKDGYLDLIFTAWNSSQSFIYWGGATGYSNANKQVLVTGNSWGGSAVADLNSDGYLDIVFHRGGGGSHQQEIFWGSATGYSVDDTSYIGAPIQATGGLVADLNSDSHLDIFCNAYSPGSESPIFWGPDFNTSTNLAVNNDHHGMFREIGDVYDRSYSEQYISSVFDAGEFADWGIITWDDSLPAGTSCTFYVRSGNTPSYDPTWSNWCMLSNGEPVPDSLDSRYIQYMTVLTFANPAYLPCLYEVGISYDLGPCVEVTSPNGGEHWVRGTAHEITWTSYGVTGNINIELYKGGSYNSTIVSSTVNDSTYSWDISSGQLPGVDYRVRISSISNPALFDFSDGDFTICSQIVLIAPNGGETWHVGEDYDIIWAPSGIGGDVKIEYSTNSGSSWTLVDSAIADAGSYSWTIPNTPTAEGRIKVTHLACVGNYDVSDGDFTITEYGITVSSPNGGESWIRGIAHDITWVSSGVSGNVKIELFKGGSYNSTIADSTANDGHYTWGIGSGQLPGTDYQVKISSINDPAVFDVSDDDFVICSQIVVTTPNGGEIWYVGDAYDITWATSGIGGSVFVEYTTNNGSTWLVVCSDTSDDGSYTWTVPNTPTTEGKVKITHLTCTTNCDESDSNFTITYSAITEQEEIPEKPSAFYLHQNQPNPCGGITTIEYALPKSCWVEILLYDITGKEVAAVLQKNLLYGYYQTNIDVNNIAGRRLSNGLYFYRIIAGDYIETKSMTVLR